MARTRRALPRGVHRGRRCLNTERGGCAVRNSIHEPAPSGPYLRQRFTSGPTGGGQMRLSVRERLPLPTLHAFPGPGQDHRGPDEHFANHLLWQRVATTPTRRGEEGNHARRH